MKCLARSLRVHSWQRRLLGYVFTKTLFSFLLDIKLDYIFRPFSQTSVVFKMEINCYLWAKVAKRGCTLPMLSLNITWMEKTEDLDERRGKIHTWKVSQERTRIQTVSTGTLTLDWDLPVSESSSALTNIFLYLSPPSPMQFQCHTNMGSKEMEDNCQ